MANNPAENLNFRLVTTGNPLVDNRQPSNLRPLTLEKLNAYIDVRVKDKKLAELVKKLAKGYPQQALWSFKKNIQTHIGRAQKQLAQQPLETGELGDEAAKKDQNLDSIRDIPNEFN
jgi:hypothetical protein